MKTKLLLWDWNGTLIDDMWLSIKLLNELLSEHGYPQSYTTAEYREIFRFPISDYYTLAGFDFSRHSYEHLAEIYMQRYVPQSLECTLFDGAKPALELAKANGLRQVVLSASPRDLLKEQITERGILDYFDDILGLGDIYAASKVELGVKYMREAGISPDSAAMIGDSVHDFEVATALGVRPVLYSGGHQAERFLTQTGAAVSPTLEGAVRLVLGQE